MEARLRHAAAQRVPVFILAGFERHREVERTECRQARARGDDARFLSRRSRDGPFVRVRRKELDPPGNGVRVAKKRMRRLDQRDPMEIAVVSGVVVGPGDRRCPPVVRREAGRIRLGILRLEVVRVADAAERTQRDAHVLVIPRGQDAPAALAESGDSQAVGGREPVPGVQGEEPQLVERRAIQRGEHRVVPARIGFAISSGHLESSLLLPERGKVFREKRETLDRPIVRPAGSGRLDENANRSFHFGALVVGGPPEAIRSDSPEARPRERPGRDVQLVRPRGTPGPRFICLPLKADHSSHSIGNTDRNRDPGTLPGARAGLRVVPHQLSCPALEPVQLPAIRQAHLVGIQRNVVVGKRPAISPRDRRAVDDEAHLGVEHRRARIEVERADEDPRAGRPRRSSRAGSIRSCLPAEHRELAVARKMRRTPQLVERDARLAAGACAAWHSRHARRPRRWPRARWSGPGSRRRASARPTKALDTRCGRHEVRRDQVDRLAGSPTICLSLSGRTASAAGPAEPLRRIVADHARRLPIPIGSRPSTRSRTKDDLLHALAGRPPLRAALDPPARPPRSVRASRCRSGRRQKPIDGIGRAARPVAVEIARDVRSRPDRRPARRGPRTGPHRSRRSTRRRCCGRRRSSPGCRR